MTFEQCLAQAVRHHQAGRLQEAWHAYRQALALKPRNPDALHRFGLLAHQTGQNELAAELIETAIEAASPKVPARYYGNLGWVLCQLGYADAAESALRKALAREPAVAMWHNNLGNALYLKGHLTDAAGAWHKAVELDPGAGQALSNYANALQDMGRIEEAMAAHQRAIQIGSDVDGAWDNYLRDLGFLAEIDPHFVRREHERWAAAYLQTLDTAKVRASHDNVRDHDRPLRLGLLSADFRQHSVAYFIEPVLRHLDRAAFEVFCYANVHAPDETTARLRQYPALWRNLVGLNDSQAADVVAQDRIDILVDLGGHTAANRLRVLAYRPAPVQMTYLGYPCTTGLPACGYRLTDTMSDPPGMTDTHYTEKLVRLPVPSWCYQPALAAGPVTAPPHEQKGFITFGSFNAANKINDRVLDAWARILAGTPDSRLLIKARGLGDPGAMAVLLQRIEARGVAGKRVDTMGWELETGAHLARYASVDIALDTFPYNGTTTTCEALWQGVPVITLEGHMHIARVGLTLLQAANLDDYMGRTVDDYVAIAMALAADPARLSELRHGLRERMAASPLCDQCGFARSFATTLRDAWCAWCGL
jgi:predicted O-linked N-acetylglucosamine transferase (SPINDLY family)